MRRLVTTSLILAASALQPSLVRAQLAQGDGSLAGARELAFFGSGRVLSTEYSVEDGKSAFGGAMTFGTHLRSMLAVQGGIAVNYSRQEYSYYRPPLLTFTPTISLILQRSTAADVQPYALVGAGYEFIRYTKPRCDCDQNRSLGVGNLGLGIRKMMGPRRAFRAEVSSQIGKGGPAFTGMAGVSMFIGGPDRIAQQNRPRPPGRVRAEPPLIPTPVERTTVRPAARPPGQRPTPAVTTPAPGTPTPAPTTPRTPQPSPLPAGVGTVLLAIDGTQVDFTKPTWREEAEPLIDGLVVDLTSDAGLRIKVSIEAHTDNVGSSPANIMIGLDRARAVREYLVTQGVGQDRIRVSSSGEDQPAAPNTTAIGRQQNRRIIIKRDN